MKSKILLIVGIACIFLSACRTAEQAAQRHIRLAIKKDPDIIKKQYTDTVIVGVAQGIDTVYIPGKTVQSPPLNCDSIFKKLSAREAKGEKNPIEYLYQDSTLKLSVTKDEDGKLRANVNIEPRVIEKLVYVPFKVPVKVAGVAIEKPVNRPPFVYWWFWGLLLYSIATTYILLKSSDRVRIFIENIRSKNEQNPK